ncbi:MAG: ATP-binding protein, partial [Spirochaetota bacterium]
MHHSVCDFLLDIVQNSIEAGSGVITVDLVEKKGILSVCVGDDGKGMDAETLSRVCDPFCTDGVKHEKRSIGLGLPF